MSNRQSQRPGPIEQNTDELPAIKAEIQDLRQIAEQQLQLLRSINGYLRTIAERGK